ncbi:MAG: hypothetical protein AAFZ05_11915 [Pseudomonadota bacterium]
MMSLAYVFVAFIYLAIAASFLATTGVLAYEFADAGWVDLLAIDSHLFVFFPTFGIVALLAFYLPSVAFVDHYWRNVKWGHLRFWGGIAVVCAISFGGAQYLLASDNRPVWDIKPSVLKADRGTPAGCFAGGGETCLRAPILSAVANLRTLSQQRIGLSEFVRTCQSDRLIEPQPFDTRKKYCVATTPLSPAPNLVSDSTCCRAQGALVDTIQSLYETPANRSLTGKVHALLLPAKIFFFLILLSISLLLLWRFDEISKHYARRLTHIEFGLIIGTIATLFFPLMSQAFLLSLSVLAGDAGQGTFSYMVPRMSIAFGIWTFLIIVYFFRSQGENTELLTKVGSAAAGFIALVKYDEIVAVMVRLIGSGTSWLFLAALAALALLAALLTMRQMAKGDQSPIGAKRISDDPPFGTAPIVKAPVAGAIRAEGRSDIDA